MPVVDPHAWQALIFGDESALIDMLGSHELFLRSLDHVLAPLGIAYPHLPLGDRPQDQDWPTWLSADQGTHEGMAVALGIAAPPDLTSYDLGVEDQFHSWTWQHGLDCIRLRQAAGI